MAHDLEKLDGRVEEIRRMTQSLTFEAGFADRVMARLAQPRPLSSGLTRVFVHIAPWAVAAALVLGTMNLINTRASGQPFVDRVLGLRPVTLASAFSLDDALAAPPEVTP